MRDIAHIAWCDLTADEKRDRIRPYLERGYSRSRIAELVGTTKSGVVGVTNRMPDYAPTRPKKALWPNDARMAAARAMAADGKTWLDIIAALREMPGEPLPMFQTAVEWLVARGVSAARSPRNAIWRRPALKRSVAPKPSPVASAPRPVAAPRVVQVAPPPTPKPPPVPRYGRVEPCSWPIGEPGTRAFRYCDDPTEPGRPYCGEHCKLAFVRVRPRGGEFQFGWTPGVAAE